MCDQAKEENEAEQTARVLAATPAWNPEKQGERHQPLGRGTTFTKKETQKEEKYNAIKEEEVMERKEIKDEKYRIRKEGVKEEESESEEEFRPKREKLTFVDDCKRKLFFGKARRLHRMQ